MNQTDVARILGISQQTYAKYETGLLVPSEDMQVRIAAVFGVSVGTIFPSLTAMAS